MASWTVSTSYDLQSYGLRAIDGPFGDFNDPDAYIDAAKEELQLV